MTQRSQSFQLVLFFTGGVSLRTWIQNGSIEREIALYYRLQEKGVKVSFVTYGNAQDLTYEKTLHGIKINCNRWGLPPRLYQLYLTRLFPWLIQPKAVFKSNQVQGADVAMEAARRSNKPFVARCGYLLSDFNQNEFGTDSSKAIEARKLEQNVFTGADQIVVTTSQMKEKIISNYQLPKHKIRIIPNYVETDRFCPQQNADRLKNRVITVGRLEPQKNLTSLLEACAGLDIELLIVGRGNQEQQLKTLADKLGIKVNFQLSVPNDQLPNLLNTGTAFILPSLYEGHPKSLLEAMSCGLPVIGTNVSGIREVISHRETGYLCGTSSIEIHNALQEVLGNPTLQHKLGENARHTVMELFSLDKIIDLEIDMLNELVESKP